MNTPKTVALLVSLMSVMSLDAAAAEAGAPEVEAAPRLRLTLDVDPAIAYTIGLGYGGQLHLERGLFSMWNTPFSTGVLQAGALVGYEFEPNAVMDPYIAGRYTGANHRLSLLLTAGAAVQLGQARRFSFGLSLFAGYGNYTISGALDDPSHDIHRSVVINRGAFDSGGLVKLGVRFSNRLGVNAFLAAPFPYNPYPLVGILRAGLGLTIWLD